MGNRHSATASGKCSKKDQAKYDHEYDSKQALKYAELSNLVYFSYEERVEQELPEYSLKAVAKIDNKDTDTEGFIAADPDEQLFVVAISGTESIQDVETDLEIHKIPIILDQPESAQGHKGFILQTNSIYDHVADTLKPHIASGKRIVLTGHSLGGAVTTLLAYRLAKAFPDRQDQLVIYTYACPLVGDEQFLEVIKGLKSYSITCEDDPISYGVVLEDAAALISLYKPGKLQLLPGGGHELSHYLEILKQRLETESSQ